jgi:UDP-N-acetyl-2-amino-2-deoxyglucuronate dehydrogenase
MTAPRYRVALVGCGRISRNHFEAIASTPGLELTAVCDIVPERADQVARELGVRAYHSYAEMLATAPCDLVSVTTPSGLHPEHAMQAARAGKHVISEKPMGISLAAADEMLEVCDRAGVRLFVVMQNRLNPAIQLLRRAIDKGRFGRIYSVNSTVRWTRPQEYYDQASWRGTWALDGGAIMNQASHYVDLLQWLGGPVESVMAYTATLARKIEAEDTGVAVMKYRSGALGVLEVTMLTHPKNLEGSVTILGEHGTVKIGGTSVNRVEHWDFADYDDDDKRVETAATNPPSVYGFGHQGYYRNVLAALQGHAPPDTDGISGRASLELILAVYRSAREGVQVALPLTSTSTR